MALSTAEDKWSIAENKWGDYWNQYQWPLDPNRQQEFARPQKSRLWRWCWCCRGHSRDHQFEVRKSKYICCFRRRQSEDLRNEKPKSTATEFNDLWDLKDPAFLDKVACDCMVKVTAVDPKNSRFEVRMKCKWSFRTGHRYEKTETKLRVPGVRLPGLIVTVDESRLWKDLDQTRTSMESVLWRGISRFTISGFERFEMHHFPFDRQVVSMDMFDFVWCSDEAMDEFDFSMNLVSLHVKCVSCLPEWEPFTPIVSAINVTTPQDKHTEGYPPPFASRFSVKLRLERANWYYIVQVFGLTVMITIASFLGVCIPLLGNLADRLSLYAAGVLTLTSFKYSVSDQLPSVPYSTMFDWCILFQFLTLILCAAETLVAFRIVSDSVWDDPNTTSTCSDTEPNCTIEMTPKEVFESHVRAGEDAFFVALCIGWMLYWLYIAGKDLGFSCGLHPQDWLYILGGQELQADLDELENFGQKRDKGQIDAINESLNDIFKDINATRQKIADAPETHADTGKLTNELLSLQKKRETLEQDLFKLVKGEELKQEEDAAASSMDAPSTPQTQMLTTPQKS